MIKATIYLKNGVSFTVEVESLSISHSRLDGKITGIEWKAARNKPHPTYICIDDISAIVSQNVDDE